MAVGIPPEPLKHIFDFGLVTNYPITQQHLGEIQMASPVGKGTEVKISLSMDEPL